MENPSKQYKSFLEPQGKRTVLWDWLTTTDHKRIGLLYLYAITSSSWSGWSWGC